MADMAWACRITRANEAVIISEKPGFDKAEFEKWLADHGETGFFVREPGMTFDCRYMSDTVFNQMYIFESGDTKALFRRIIKR